MRVRCIDNTLAADVLDVDRVYEVTKVHKRDGYYALAGVGGKFSITRFVPVTPPDEVAS